MILVIQHIAIEGPGTLKHFIHQKGAKMETVDLSKAQTLPVDPAGVDAVICLGGPMNVYQEDKYPFLKEENKFIQQVAAKGIPYLGVCLGAQLLAKAVGMKVLRSPEKEVGFYPVMVTAQGLQDPLFEGVPPEIDVFHWHEDMAQALPPAARLAYSQRCPYQAFRAGARAYGLQFHVEVTGEEIGQWADAYFLPGGPEREKKKRALLSEYEQKKQRFHSVAEKIYNNFWKILQSDKWSPQAKARGTFK